MAKNKQKHSRLILDAASKNHARKCNKKRSFKKFEGLFSKLKRFSRHVLSPYKQIIEQAKSIQLLRDQEDRLFEKIVNFRIKTKEFNQKLQAKQVIIERLQAELKKLKDSND